MQKKDLDINRIKNKLTVDFSEHEVNDLLRMCFKYNLQLDDVIRIAVRNLSMEVNDYGFTDDFSNRR